VVTCVRVLFPDLAYIPIRGGGRKEGEGEERIDRQQYNQERGKKNKYEKKKPKRI
jgi:hypothetical protein